jgi:signal transduction histidine kinase
MTDTGHGLDAEQAAGSSSPSTRRSAEGKGTGLGLSVTHGILKSHGGSSPSTA